MERKRFTREVHKSWGIRRIKRYGFTAYDKSLCNYICQHVPRGSKLLEAAIGTGYPNADFLQKAGYAVHGIDITPELIEQCRGLNPKINCKVGDAEDLEYPDNYFDATYCLHSTWYLPNLNKAIDEMIRVTRQGGTVVFDIMNRNNKDIDDTYRRALFECRGWGRAIGLIKSVGSFVLRRGVPNWRFVTHETPTYPESIYDRLRKHTIASFRVMVTKDFQSVEATNDLGSLEDFPRLIFVIEK